MCSSRQLDPVCACLVFVCHVVTVQSHCRGPYWLMVHDCGQITALSGKSHLLVKPHLRVKPHPRVKPHLRVKPLLREKLQL